MSVDVREISLHDAVKFIVDNRGKTVPTADNGIPLIATNCIKNNGLFPVFEKIRFVSEETYKTWFRSHPEPGDIIFVNKGTPGRVCLVPNPVNFCIAQDMVALRVDESVIYPKYLFAALRSDYIQNVIENMHVGTLIPHFKKSDFERLMIPVPDEVTQKYIGNLYYDLSMAIELNNQINKTLEEMAQAIFKSWFVDFEPFKDGEFEESELGMIPKGWNVKRIDQIDIEITDYVANGSFAALKENVTLCDEEDYAVFIRNVDLKANSFNKFVDKKSYEFLRKTKLWGGEVIISNVGDVGSVFRCPLLAKPMTLGNNMIMLKSISPVNYNLFLYILFKYSYGIELIKSITSGSAQPKFNKTDFRNLKIIVPPKEVIQLFNNIVEKLYRIVDEGIVENQLLSTVRDTLLPKLMSGEIRVPVEGAM